jgi:histidinol dehydrogenase
MLTIISSRNRAAVDRLLSTASARDRLTEAKARAIVERVRRGGDAALARYARELDGHQGPIEVPRRTWERGANSVPVNVRDAIAQAAASIRRVAKRQTPESWRLQVGPGVVVEQRVVPLGRVGCYVPAGRYPLPSSLLMTAIPARAAGVDEVIVCCPRPDGAVFAAALEAGADRVFQIGGAHAVAAMAYGTATVPRVDKIVGPGNRWVSAAKSIVSVDCAIDFFAGPTEIVILTDSGPARWIAADLIAQAEHDPDARAVLITTKQQLAENVSREVEARLSGSEWQGLEPTRSIARTALRRHGGIIVCRTVDEAVQLADRAAAEHLVVGSDALARRVRHAGAIFVGGWTAQVAGDYAIGSNHVLPTAGAARFRGGLNTADFVKLVSVQRMSRTGLQRIAPTVTTLARAEGLEAHARSIEVRARSRDQSTNSRLPSSPTATRQAPSSRQLSPNSRRPASPKVRPPGSRKDL